MFNSWDSYQRLFPLYASIMKLHDHPQFFIIFGDKQLSFDRHQFYGLQTSQELLQQQPFCKVSQNIKTLIVVDQSHGTDGLIITSLEQAHAYKPYSCTADFIITNVPEIGLGIATADCLPIIFFDSKKNVLAVAHAGWQGTVAGIAVKVVCVMQEHFGTRLEDLQIFFGPCATVENYEVAADFGEKIELFPQTFIHKNNKHFFNIPLYNQLLLESIGVPKTAFIGDYCQCTIANKNFCSYRRDKNNQRQMTIAYLKNCS